ncbi:MAG: 3-oxoacyl-[acyl-carrier-protein] reductase [Candidatus Izemoplasmatales bacterium]
MSIEGKVAIVTGGAVGIGRAISLTLAQAGVSIVCNYHSSDTQAKTLQDEIAAFGGKCMVMRADVGDFDEAQSLVEFAVQSFGSLDILVNNAGITRDNLIMRMSEDDFDHVIRTNLKGTWNMSKHASKIMAKQRSGSIVNITSVSGLIGAPGQTNYSASKAGVIGLTMALAREYAKRNVRVNAIAPGFIQTAMTEKLSEEMIQAYLQQIPLGRLGEVSDIADAVLFLASDQSRYMTGQTIHVDGGMVMG